MAGVGKKGRPSGRDKARPPDCSGGHTVLFRSSDRDGESAILFSPPMRIVKAAMV